MSDAKRQRVKVPRWLQVAARPEALLFDVSLPATVADKLRQQAAREGTTPEALASRLLTEALAKTVLE